LGKKRKEVECWRSRGECVLRRREGSKGKGGKEVGGGKPLGWKKRDRITGERGKRRRVDETRGAGKHEKHGKHGRRERA
jgi:hypothetical protein